MLTTKEAIEKRRSIRRFKSTPVPQEHLLELVESAKLAPSGCNAQPWRFKIVSDQDTKEKLAHVAFDQSSIVEAPVVIVCCADIGGYLDSAVSGVQDLGRIGAIEERLVSITEKRTNTLVKRPIEQVWSTIAFNVAIAIEHMVLRALDFGLGTCWIKLFDGPEVNSMFGWDDRIYTVTLLPIGYPAENPPQRKRMSVQSLLL
uniref:Nitroreductase n=1 Tax=Candidatus Kentrum sp. TUN TaxID=2126343 RepID=A0A450ZS75_9GAMM|nr:MAG: Nitroreductase [Candidatus Kentron sp. TUN]VFK59153.1 MAG: Nitroreductase [Candidatus Kentron sp. TUN]VFK62955.1 MAG: Nitroreductase [Candidatus Kentron sp. TUN]